MAVIFQIVTDLQNGLILEKRFQNRDGVGEGDLLRPLYLGLQREARLPVAFHGAPAMAERDIAGPAGGERHRDPDKLSGRRVQ